VAQAKESSANKEIQQEQLASHMSGNQTVLHHTELQTFFIAPHSKESK